MKRFIYSNARILALVWALFIFILCATPGRFIPTISWLELLSFDKLVHATLFFVLYSLLQIAAAKHTAIFSPATFRIVYFFSCIMYGLLLELMQARIFSDRSADWLDVVANTVGVLVSLFLSGKILAAFANRLL